jgi:hypothetical protein
VAWIAGCSAAGSLPGGWNSHTFWQCSLAGKLPGDQDIFNGSGDSQPIADASTQRRTAQLPLGRY